MRVTLGIAREDSTPQGGFMTFTIGWCEVFGRRVFAMPTDGRQEPPDGCLIAEWSPSDPG